MQILERAAAEVYGQAVRVRLAFGEASRPSRAGRAAAGGREPGGTSDPVVRKVIEMFDGEIKNSRREG